MSATYQAVGTVASQGGTVNAPGTADVTGTAIPSGAGTGKLVVTNSQNAIDAPPLYDNEIWDLVGDALGGSGVYAVDSGKRIASAFWTENNIDGTSQKFINGGANDAQNAIHAYCLRFGKDDTYFAPPAAAEAVMTPGGPGSQGTFNVDPGFEAGDVAVLVLIANTDAVNPAGIALTLPGTTQGTGTTNVATSPFATGNDSRMSVRYVNITGTSNGTPPSVSSTTAFSGCALLIRIRDTNVQPIPAPVAAAGGDSVVEPWNDFVLDGSTSSYDVSTATVTWTDITAGAEGFSHIEEPNALVTVAHVDPVLLTDEPFTFQLEIVDAGGTSTDTVIKTVLRPSTVVTVGGVDKPARIQA